MRNAVRPRARCVRTTLQQRVQRPSAAAQHTASTDIARTCTASCRMGRSMPSSSENSIVTITSPPSASILAARGARRGLSGASPVQIAALDHNEFDRVLAGKSAE